MVQCASVRVGRTSTLPPPPVSIYTSHQVYKLQALHLKCELRSSIKAWIFLSSYLERSVVSNAGSLQPGVFQLI